ncbi:hypothetical protein CRUP_030293 [Coryphaenoides rupestris]|nr:hypothetical protein CRUP_030293 [Coryphaenoides rupestris]
MESEERSEVNEDPFPLSISRRRRGLLGGVQVVSSCVVIGVPTARQTDCQIRRGHGCLEQNRGGPVDQHDPGEASPVHLRGPVCQPRTQTRALEGARRQTGYIREGAEKEMGVPADPVHALQEAPGVHHQAAVDPGPPAVSGAPHIHQEDPIQAHCQGIIGVCCFLFRFAVGHRHGRRDPAQHPRRRAQHHRRGALLLRGGAESLRHCCHPHHPHGRGWRPQSGVRKFGRAVGQSSAKHLRPAKRSTEASTGEASQEEDAALVRR